MKKREKLGDLSGPNEDLSDVSLAQLDRMWLHQREVLDAIVQPGTDLTKTFGLRVTIALRSLKNIWEIIKPRYQFLTSGMPPLSRYVRDLILADIGVDIEMLHRDLDDPLCAEGVAEELIRMNPWSWSEIEENFLRWRGMGCSYRRIEELALQKYGNVGETSLSSIGRFLRGVREAVFDVKLDGGTKRHAELLGLKPKTEKKPGRSKKKTTPPPSPNCLTDSLNTVKRKRGRPKKVRPEIGDGTTPGAG